VNLFQALFVGLVTGLHTATWGAFKDSPFEGFAVQKMVRTIALASACAVLLALMAGRSLDLFVFIGVVLAAERLGTEWWKGIVREDDQEAYAIPMRLAVHGRIVQSRAARYLTGGVVALLLVSAAWSAAVAQAWVGNSPVLLDVLVGGVGGWLTAVGGAWKDAPVEGFSGAKFLRSPLVATTWAVVLQPFTESWLVLAVAAGGWSVASIETYKTFLTGGRPPGKFSAKPVRHQVSRPRTTCRLLHAACLGALVSGAAVRLLAHPGDGAARGWPSREITGLAVVLFAVVQALLVLTSRCDSVTVEARQERVGVVRR
jgi:hypothetical protein